MMGDSVEGRGGKRRLVEKRKEEVGSLG